MMIEKQLQLEDKFFRFSGYASVFHKPDTQGDIILPGAFDTSLTKKTCHNIKMLYQHDVHYPIGKWIRIIQDKKGLYVVGDLLTTTMTGHEVSHLVREKIINGLSIGFHTKYANYGRTKNQRYISDLDLLEISLVTFPMHTEARLLKYNI